MADDKVLIKQSLPTLAKKREHKFWDAQPVPKCNDVISASVNECIDANVLAPEIRQTPYPLIDDHALEWHDCDVTNDQDMKDIYALLSSHYVEDDDNMFRFDYSMGLLKWAMCPPGWKPVWHVGIRRVSDNKLVGFVTAIPARIRIYEKELSLVEINFLCVHKGYRGKGLAPTLIQEITRRANLAGIFQATYTAGAVLSKPLASCQYFHRPLNPKKLLDIGFSYLPPRRTLKMTMKLYALPEEPRTKGLRPLEEKDIPRVTTLLSDYLQSKTKFHPVLSEDDVRHWLLPREDIIVSYVSENAHGKITDLLSFYCLHSTIIGHSKHTTFRAAYSYYSVATSVPLRDLMYDALIIAKRNNLDVFNCLDLMDNKAFLKDLKFDQGTGRLQYYIYNWRCPSIPADHVGLVLL